MSNLVSQGPCPSCGSSDANSLYDDGHTYCYSCGAYSHGEGPVEDAAEPKVSGLIKSGEFSAWKSRKLTEETCRKWGISLTKYKGKSVRVFAYKDAQGQTKAQKLRFSDKSFAVLGEKRKLGLFGMHLWRDGGKMIVVTEGEIDAASVSQVQGHKWPVVSIPNGAQGAKKSLQKHLDWLSCFETVVLMFDNDEPGIKAAQECASLFKPGQCKIAKLELKDANEMLLAGRGKEIIDAIWGAKEYRPDGIVLGSDLWEELTKEEEVFSLPYPWQGLQEKTRGCRLGEVVTLCAGSGIGKSSLIRHIALHLLQQGETIGMLMLEESVKSTALSLIGTHMGKNLVYCSQPQKEEGFEAAFRETLGTGRVILYDHFGSTEIENILSRIRYMAKGYNARWIFVDHLSILVSGMEEGDERRIIDNAMTAIKTLAMECNVGIFLVSHLKRPEGRPHEEGGETRLGQLRGSGAIGQLSDIVIGVERNQQDEKLRDVSRLRILKNRYTGETGIAGWLSFDRFTNRLTEHFDEPTGDYFPADGEAY